jgi:hypothetical protein
LSRGDSGEVAAFCRTIWFVLRHPQRFGAEVWCGSEIDAPNAKRFRNRCVSIAAASVAAFFAITLFFRMPTLAVLLICSIVGAGAWAFFWLVTKCGENLVLHERNDPWRFADLLPFTAGPLALYPIVPVLLGIARATDDMLILLFIPVAVVAVFGSWLWATAVFHCFGGRRRLRDVILYALIMPCQWAVIAIPIGIVGGIAIESLAAITDAIW